MLALNRDLVERPASDCFGGREGSDGPKGASHLFCRAGSKPRFILTGSIWCLGPRIAQWPSSTRSGPSSFQEADIQWRRCGHSTRSIDDRQRTERGAPTTGEPCAKCSRGAIAALMLTSSSDGSIVASGGSTPSRRWCRSMPAAPTRFARLRRCSVLSRVGRRCARSRPSTDRPCCRRAGRFHWRRRGLPREAVIQAFAVRTARNPSRTRHSQSRNPALLVVPRT
jgi:hypothetical protein